MCRQVPRSALGRRIALGMVAGALVTALLVAAGLGIRPDLQRHAWLLLLDEMDLHRLAGDWRGDSGDAVARPIHKACAVCGGSAYRCCCWPGSALASWSTPLARVAGDVAGSQLEGLPVAGADPGHADLYRPAVVLPPHGAHASARGGRGGGPGGGRWAATIYCLHCPEVSAIFVLTWYSLGILLAAGIGALLARN
jgi:hypothetical protein